MPKTIYGIVYPGYSYRIQRNYFKTFAFMCVYVYLHAHNFQQPAELNLKSDKTYPPPSPQSKCLPFLLSFGLEQAETRAESTRKPKPVLCLFYPVKPKFLIPLSLF